LQHLAHWTTTTSYYYYYYYYYYNDDNNDNGNNGHDDDDHPKKIDSGVHLRVTQPILAHHPLNVGSPETRWPRDLLMPPTWPTGCLLCRHLQDMALKR